MLSFLSYPAILAKSTQTPLTTVDEFRRTFLSLGSQDNFVLYRVVWGSYGHLRLGMHPPAATSQLLVAIIPSWTNHFPAIIKYNPINNQQIILPASQTNQSLPKTNYLSSSFLLPRAANKSLLFILDSVYLSVATCLHILYSLLRPGTLALYPVTLKASFPVPCLEESTSARGGHSWARLGWPQRPPGHRFCSSLNLRLPLCYTDLLELFKMRSFWITRLRLHPSLFWHLSPVEFLGSSLEEATMSKQKWLPGFIEFQMKATNTTKPHRICLWVRRGEDL